VTGACSDETGRVSIRLGRGSGMTMTLCVGAVPTVAALFGTLTLVGLSAEPALDGATCITRRLPAEPAMDRDRATRHGKHAERARSTAASRRAGPSTTRAELRKAACVNRVAARANFLFAAAETLSCRPAALLIMPTNASHQAGGSIARILSECRRGRVRAGSLGEAADRSLQTLAIGPVRAGVIGIASLFQWVASQDPRCSNEGSTRVSCMIVCAGTKNPAAPSRSMAVSARVSPRQTGAHPSRTQLFTSRGRE
jgi:hypothetical protein